jgi:2-succinyl-6-hydroxy-2,4-cyclohexadiene-1-carboxylate synthase
MPARSDQADGTVDRSDRLVFLHGFTQTHHHWHRCAQVIAARMGDDPPLAFVDLPGHGLSDDDRLDIDLAGTPLCELAGRGTYIGYSMGGRFGLVAALADPRAVERLVLVGATPGIDDHRERADRRHADAERADRIERTGVDAFLDEWLAAPLFATLPPERRGLEHRRRNTAGGLASSLRAAGTGSQTPLWNDLDRITIPVLVLAGALDTKFTDIGERMTERLPNATFAPVPDAGHAAHSEQPEATADIIARWLVTV